MCGDATDAYVIAEGFETHRIVDASPRRIWLAARAVQPGPIRTRSRGSSLVG
jgi:hypothetical protein